MSLFANLFGSIFQTLYRVLNGFWEMNVWQCLFMNVKQLRSVDLVILILVRTSLNDVGGVECLYYCTH